MQRSPLVVLVFDEFSVCVDLGRRRTRLTVCPRPASTVHRSSSSVWHSPQAYLSRILRPSATAPRRPSARQTYCAAGGSAVNPSTNVAIASLRRASVRWNWPMVNQWSKSLVWLMLKSKLRGMRSFCHRKPSWRLCRRASRKNRSAAGRALLRGDELADLLKAQERLLFASPVAQAWTDGPGVVETGDVVTGEAAAPGDRAAAECAEFGLRLWRPDWRDAGRRKL